MLRKRPLLLLVPLFCLAFTEAESGSLTIRSQPRVEILWEGVPIGETDEAGTLRIRRIPLGRFPVTLRKEGFTTRTVQVTISPKPARLDLELSRIVPRPPAALPASPMPASGFRVGSAVEPQPIEPAAEIGTSPAADTPPARKEPGPASAPPPAVATAMPQADSAAASRPRGGKGLTTALALTALAIAAAVALAMRLRPSPAAAKPSEESGKTRRSRRKRRRRPSVEPALASPTAPQAGATNAAPANASFLKELRQRELELDDDVDLERLRAQGRVVEVEVIDSRPIEEDA